MQRAQQIGKHVGFLLAIAAAAVVGGLTTALVSAAIPDNKGVIHGCYTNLTGTLRVIDSASQSCSASETALNWDKATPLPKPGDTLDGVQFTYRDLSGINLSNTSLRGVNFTGSDLSHANLAGAEMTSITANQAKFNNVDFRVLPSGLNGMYKNTAFKNANFANMGLDDLDFTGSNFTNANISNGSMSRTILKGSVLTNTDFTNEAFNEVTFLGANLSTANLTGATWSNVVCPDGVNSNANSNTCVGHLVP